MAVDQNLATRPKTRAMELAEFQHGIELGAYLTEEYHGKNRRLADIAADLDVDTGTVSRWMDRLGISRRIRTKVAAA